MKTPVLPCPHCGRGLRRSGQQSAGTVSIYWHCVGCNTRHKTDHNLNFQEIRRSLAVHKCPKCTSPLKQSGGSSSRHGKHWYVCTNRTCDGRYSCADGVTLVPTRQGRAKQRPPCPKCSSPTWDFRKKPGTLGGWGRCLNAECRHKASYDDEGREKMKREPAPVKEKGRPGRKPGVPNKVKPVVRAEPQLTPAVQQKPITAPKPEPQRLSARRRLEDLRDERVGGVDLW